ncbi:giy-yig catalytic domain containing protein [Ophiostoma piceae UAMH 11346]|uniref:Giy-yig catalytic domain containing protein n=1 Tax=Ophiostoma piceae (strain UAMH 11346) TaxID=1262450 RepID=S3C6R8_OPHP1|nr:giy-yig catalytic domain containing protein [Ophiostoma piceae UAMH 11346]
MDTDSMPRMSASAIAASASAVSAAATVSTVVTKPIPALYTVYVLRSTMRHASLYIGSTPDPPRRLKQHNGEMKGGAVRTSRASLRPWEMVAFVSGFPGSVAALKFEWALTNPHLSLHIPAESRLSVSRQTKKNGHPRRPPASMQSIVANLHLLLGVPSFTRWPLRLHVFAPEVLAAWNKWLKTSNNTKPPTLELVTDFSSASSSTTDTEAKTGVHAMPVDYTPLQDYVDKARDIFTFEREGDCAVCHETLPSGQNGLYAVCPNTSCEAVGHLRCWSGYLLSKEAPMSASDTEDELVGAVHTDKQPLMPVRGNCPKCGGPVVWADMMKELTLRLRAPKEVDKLVKAKRKQEKAAVAVVEAEAASDVDSVVEIESDGGQSQTKSPRARKTAAKVTKSTKSLASTAAKAAKATTTKATMTKATKTKTVKAKPRAKAAADKTPKITKTARVTKRKDSSAKKIDVVHEIL